MFGNPYVVAFGLAWVVAFFVQVLKDSLKFNPKTIATILGGGAGLLTAVGSVGAGLATQVTATNGSVNVNDIANLVVQSGVLTIVGAWLPHAIHANALQGNGLGNVFKAIGGAVFAGQKATDPPSP